MKGNDQRGSKLGGRQRLQVGGMPQKRLEVGGPGPATAESFHLNSHQSGAASTRRPYRNENQRSRIRNHRSQTLRASKKPGTGCIQERNVNGICRHRGGAVLAGTVGSATLLHLSKSVSGLRTISSLSPCIPWQRIADAICWRKSDARKRRHRQYSLNTRIRYEWRK